MFSSTARDEHGWPIEMHGLVADLESLIEQLEAAQEALADINSIDRGWHPPLSDEEKLGKVRLIARRALRNVSSPAGDPK